MGNYIKIEIKINSAAQSEILIAELSEINFDAFEENENILSAFIKEENFIQDEFDKIILRRNISYKKEIIEENNWNAKWESEFDPIIIEDFVAVRAGFHKPIKNVNHEIIITPKMSFGTGHHATTYLVLQQMEHIDFKNKTVLDFGTGTGVLAILAKMLGAKNVTAIDYDEWSIANAKENFAANNCSEINLLKKDSLSGLEMYDIILANINLNVITSNIRSLKNISHSSTQLLLSGFLISDKEILLKTFEHEKFICKSVDEKDGWICALLINPNATS